MWQGVPIKELCLMSVSVIQREMGVVSVCACQSQSRRCGLTFNKPLTEAWPVWQGVPVKELCLMSMSDIQREMGVVSVCACQSQSRRCGLIKELKQEIVKYYG